MVDTAAGIGRRISLAGLGNNLQADNLEERLWFKIAFGNKKDI